MLINAGSWMHIHCSFSQGASSWNRTCRMEAVKLVVFQNLDCLSIKKQNVKPFKCNVSYLKVKSLFNYSSSIFFFKFYFNIRTKLH